MCDHPGADGTRLLCTGCERVTYCSDECAAAHWVEHYEFCQAPAVMIPWQPRAASTQFRERGFYKSSAKLLRRYKKHNIFRFLTLSHYGQQSTINPLLFQVSGKLRKLAAALPKIQGFTELATPGPDMIFNAFYKRMLEGAAAIGKPVMNRSRTVIITTQQQLVTHYPELKPYLKMDKLLYLRHYVSAIQNSIIDAGPLRVPAYVYRGYIPINVPNSLSVNLDRYRVGEEIVNWAFMSVSIDSQVSSGFASRPLWCCMMMVTIPVGFPVLMLTSDRDDASFPQIHTAWFQMELLLPVGTRVRMGKRLGQRKYNAFNGGPLWLDTIEATVVGRAAVSGLIK